MVQTTFSKEDLHTAHAVLIAKKLDADATFSPLFIRALNVAIELIANELEALDGGKGSSDANL